MDTKPSEIGNSKTFGGYNRRYRHYSPTLGCSMKFHIYFPPSPPLRPSHKFPYQDLGKEIGCAKMLGGLYYFDPGGEMLQDDSADRIPKLQVMYWLTGLGCTDANFIIKYGAQRTASSEGVALIVPDTSPRGLNVEGEADHWNLGVGAGFYLNATQEKWKNWRMYDYVVEELPKLLRENFSQLDTSRASISGHSMGGHGALTIYLKNMNKYKSVSALAPIYNPINSPISQRAFTNYLGSNKAAWEEHDASHLILKCHDIPATIFIDQGVDDEHLHSELLPHKFLKACKAVNAPLLLRMQPGYDHSKDFVSTFIEDHIRHHSRALRLPSSL